MADATTLVDNEVSDSDSGRKGSEARRPSFVENSLYSEPESSKNVRSEQAFSVLEEGQQQKANNEEETTGGGLRRLTGSNNVPLGSRAEAVVIAHRPLAPSPADPTVKQEISPIQASATAQAKITALEFPPQRYLPPPGPYFDEPDLSAIFGVGYFQPKCVICWGKGHSLMKGGKCFQTCTICGTRLHPDETCSLLYCSLDWYTERISPDRLALIRRSQLRPTSTEISFLQKVGLISSFDRPILPNYHHPLVSEFYDRIPLPYRQQQALHLPETVSGTDSVRGPPHPMMKVGPKNSLCPTLPPAIQDGFSLFNQTQNVNGRYTYNPMPMTFTPQDENSSDAIPTQVSFDNGDYYDKAEARIAELEEEVLTLKKLVTVKDREIRNLRFENERFRSDTFQVGNKRPRL